MGFSWNIRNLVFASALLMLSSPLRAGLGRLGVGFGMLNPHINEVQKNLQGDKKSVNLHPYLSSQLHYHFYDQFSLAAHVALGIPQSSRDEDISKSYHFANLYAVYKLENWQFFGGPGLLFTRISGDGGTKTLNNGNTTSDFFLPSSSTTASNTTINAGAALTFFDDFKSKLHISWTNPRVSEKRSWSMAISLFYLWDLFNQKG